MIISSAEHLLFSDSGRPFSAGFPVLSADLVLSALCHPPQTNGSGKSGKKRFAFSTIDFIHPLYSISNHFSITAPHQKVFLHIFAQKYNPAVFQTQQIIQYVVFHRHLYPYIVYIWYFDKFHFTHIFPLFFRYFSAVFRSFSRFLCPCAPLLPGRRTPPALHRNRIMQKSST